MEMEEASGEHLLQDKHEETNLKQDSLVQEVNGGDNDNVTESNLIEDETVNGGLIKTGGENGADIAVSSTIVDMEDDLGATITETSPKVMDQVPSEQMIPGNEDMLDLMENDEVNSGQTADMDEGNVLIDSAEKFDSDNRQVSDVVDGCDGEPAVSAENNQSSNLSSEQVVEKADEHEQPLDLPRGNVEISAGIGTDDDVLDLNEDSFSGQINKEGISQIEDNSEVIDPPIGGGNTLCTDITPDESPANNDITQDESPVSNEVTQDENPVNSVITQDENPVNSVITQDESSVNNVITQDESSVNNDVTQDEILVSNVITQDESPVNNDVNQENLVISNVIHVDQAVGSEFTEGDNAVSSEANEEPEKEDLEISQEVSNDKEEEGMEITNEMEDKLLNNDMDEEPEKLGETTRMEGVNDTGENTEESGDIDMEKTGGEALEETMKENVEMEQDEEMVNEKHAVEEVDNTEKKAEGVSNADVSMEITDDHEENKNENVAQTNDVVQTFDAVNNEIEEIKNGEVVESEAQDAVTVIDVETATSSEEGKINSQELVPVADEDTKGTSGDDKSGAEKDVGKDQVDQPVEMKKSGVSSTDDVKLTKTTTKEEDEEDVQIIDLDADDSDTETNKGVKQENVEASDSKKDDGGLGIQITSVSGATDIPDVKKELGSNVKTEIKDVKKEAKPLVPVKQEVKMDTKASLKSKIQTCIVCKKTGKCKYNIVRNGDIKHLCDDDCFKRFRSNPTTFLRSSTPPQQQESKTVTPVNNQQGQYKTCQVCQIMNINATSSKPFLNWQGMDFCGEDCLGKFQGSLNTSCSVCTNVIQQATKGKFCLKFGNQMRQFCSQGCCNEFIKRQKLCECCQKDISKSPDAFVAPAGSDGSFKDFCSQKCLQRYEEKTNRDIEITGVEQSKKGGVVPKGTHTCSVCSKVNTMKHQVQLEGKTNYLCSDPCFSAFQYANKLTMNTCDNCGVYCYNEGMNPQYIQFEGQQKRFCSFMCVNTFKTLNKKIVSCSWCNCKKSNFDMIERVDASNKYQLFCSLNCLSLYRVNLQATSNQAVMCDQCKRYVPAQYHLTMSDASVRNFCSYNCVMSFQSQFTGSNPPSTQHANTATQPQKSGIQTRSTNRQSQPIPQKTGEHISATTAKVRKEKMISQNWSKCKSENSEKSLPAMKFKKILSQRLFDWYKLDDKGLWYCETCRSSKLTNAYAKGHQVRAKTTNHVRHAKSLPQATVKSAAMPQQNVPRPPLQNRPTNPNMNSIPIISNVVSLAPQGNQHQQVNFKSNQQVPLVINNKNSSIRTTVPAQLPPLTQIQQTVIIQPPQPKVFKNKSCLCKPFIQTKATSCRPHTQTKETQTDKDKEPHGAIIPIPIPFYVPVPVAMYSQPTPTPFPFPIPIPIPCFIPTTKKSSNSILKHIKEIHEKIPDDPLEAELLMMAEAVSAVTKDSSESESENEAEMETIEETTVAKINSPSRSASPEPAVPEKPAELGEDMLQMALRMATELTSEPVMDLEETIEPVPVNTEPPPKVKSEAVEDDEENEEDEDYTPVRETRSKGKGTKRPGGGGNTRRKSKRQKTPIVIKMVDSHAAEEPEPVVEPAPDANLYLKYTYGVNAWKHWVVQKNNQLDKVSKQGSGKLKLFKTDMLQCSADELNYSLCLFVKEVRKPNGEEYAPDSIYYLCLGIQMFLFENERIDNIFTDIYYEKFTECLNEVLQRYTPKLNAAGQIVCRIEEEHLWECKQLGAHSPHVLLNTLVYFNTKFFQLKTPDDHLKLSFTHIMKHWKKTAPGKGNAQGRSVYLRYYCPAPIRPSTDGNRKKKEELPVYEQAENLDNPLRCPVKLYEFYLSKCPESIKNRSDAFYLVPERSCVPDSPVWYSTQNLQIEAMNKMLHRTMLVREIQESFIHIQPVYA